MSGNIKITSRQNEKIKYAVSLRKKSRREQYGRFIFEGAKLYKEAVASSVNIISTYSLPDFHLLTDYASEHYEVTSEVYEKLSADNSPDGIFCIAEIPVNISNDEKKIINRCFAAVSVRDPGNLGNIIRTAYAFNIDTLILFDCADVLSEKVLRASAGAVFKQNIVISNNIEDTLSYLKNKGYISVASALSDNTELIGKTDYNPKDDKIIFLIGNEGHGLDKSVIEKCDYTVKIPMNDNSESLNASVAAAILMWETYRND